VRDWVVASAVLEADGSILLVRNRRRNGSIDWSTPGGVVDEGESVLEGLGREVTEETGLVVTEWGDRLYEVTVDAAGLGWRARVEVWRAAAFTGEIVVDDHDGIVDDARFVALASCHDHVGTAQRWVHEPFGEWLAAPDAPGGPLAFRYCVTGTAPDIVVTRLP
jgi:8-oxo-dGTP diphosphatase